MPRNVDILLLMDKDQTLPRAPQRVARRPEGTRAVPRPEALAARPHAEGPPRLELPTRQAHGRGLTLPARAQMAGTRDSPLTPLAAAYHVNDGRPLKHAFTGREDGANGTKIGRAHV